ncbi:MAG: hypothetical protein ACJAV4_000335 [Pontimonas sp.]|jgi:uncharacterized protein (DUF427 family)
MKATLNGTVIAEAPESDLARIEGNWFFPPAAVTFDNFEKSPTAYVCSWKGECTYYTVTVDGQAFQDRAFAYYELLPGAVDRVGIDFAGYVCFSNDVVVAE